MKQKVQSETMKRRSMRFVVSRKRKLSFENTDEEIDENCTNIGRDVNVSSHDEWQNNEGKRPKKIKLCSPPEATECSQKLSEYEKLAQQNRLERMKFLEQFGVVDAVNTLKQITPKPVKKRRTSIVKLVIGERRRSQRLQHIQAIKPPETIKDSLFSYSDIITERTPTGEPTEIVKFHGVQEDLEKPRLFTSSLTHLKSEAIDYLDISKDNIIRNCTSMSDLTVGKVTPSRICTVKFHPNDSQILVFAGSKTGDLGIWNINQEKRDGERYTFKIHGGAIYGMSFHNDCSNMLITSSYDGTFRKFDLNTSIVEQIYSCERNSSEFISSHCQISSSSFLVCGSKGFIDQIDLNRPTSVKRYFAHNGKKVKVVTNHPLERHYFATGGMDGKIMLWDLRNMKRNTPVDEQVPGRSISGLEFSHSGKFLLSTSWDDTVRIYQSDSGSLKNSVRIRHYNFTGRFLTPFRASWLPGRDDLFVVGSMTYPRKIELYDCEGKQIYNFMHEDLKSVCSINAFHPNLQYLAGGNSSGNMHIFRKPF